MSVTALSSARKAGGAKSMRASARQPVLTLERVDPLLNAIYDGATESPPWRSAMELLRKELQAAHVTLILRPPSSDSTGVMINITPPEEAAGVLRTVAALA